MKKHSVLLLVPALLLVLAACNKNDSDKRSDRPAPTPPPVVQPADEDGEEGIGGESPIGAGPAAEGDEGEVGDAGEIRGPIGGPGAGPREEDEAMADEPQRSLPPAARRGPPRAARPLPGGVLPNVGDVSAPGDLRADRPSTRMEVEGTPAASWLYHNFNPLLNDLERLRGPVRPANAPVRVTLALGYYDGYHKKDLNYEGQNYGRHAAVDPFLRAAVNQVLISRCQGALQLCGFKVVREAGFETIYRRQINGVAQEIRVISGALTPVREVNTGERAKEQQARSARADQSFLRSLSDSDLVVYVGHSREGGGIDFAPARLRRDDLDVDYASYKRERRGQKALIAALRGPARRARALAVLSCDTTDHFRRGLREAAPEVELITTNGVIRAEDGTTAALAALEMFLRQGQLSGVSDVLSTRIALLRSLKFTLPQNLAQR